MIRLSALFLFAALVPQLALAQTADQIAAYEQQAAAKYGISLPVLQDLILAESGANPNIGCNPSGACGIAQFIPATARQYGVDVNDAQSSINGAANYLSDLYNQNGGSYVLALTSYSGGCNTTDTPCNPAYQTAFAAAQQADNGGAGGGDVGAGGDTLAITPGPQPAANPTTLFRPFQWSWDHIMTQAQNNVAVVTPKVQQMAYAPMVPLLAICGYIWAMRFWAGRMEYGDVLIAGLTAGFTVALVVPNNPWYQQWVDFNLGMPGFIAQSLNPGGAASGPAGGFDGVWQAFIIKIENVWHNSPWERILLTALILAGTIFDIAVALGSMFLTFLTANFILYLLMTIGPAFLPGLMFPGTHGYFRFWLDLTVAVLAYILALDVMLQFFTTVLAQLIDAVNVVNGEPTPWTEMIPNLLGAIIIFNTLAGANVFLLLQVGRIHGVSSTALSRGFTGAGALLGFKAVKGTI